MDDVKKEIFETAERWSRALVADDAEAVGSFMSDDWVIVGPDGITTKQDFLPHVAGGYLTHEAMDLISEPRIEIYGDTAILTGRVTNTGQFRGMPFSADEWTTDVFMRRGDKWICVHSHITPAVDRKVT